MTKEEAQKACTIGLSEDINDKFYTIYDFDKLWDIHEEELNELQKNYEECKQTVAVLVDKYCKQQELPEDIGHFIDEHFDELL